MRLVFISSVTAMMPLRTISVTTGSALGFFTLFLAIVSTAPAGSVVGRVRRRRNPPFSSEWRITLTLIRPTYGDHQIAISVDLQRVARHQQGGRCVLLDQRRAFDAVTGHEGGAPIGRRRPEARCEIDRPLSGERGLVRLAGAARNLPRRWLAHEAGHGGAQADDLRAFLRRRGAIAPRVHLVEMALDRRTILFREHTQRQVDRDGVLLADIAHVSGALDDDLVRLHRGAGDRVAALLFQLAVDLLDVRERSLVEAHQRGAHEIVA